MKDLEPSAGTPQEPKTALVERVKNIKPLGQKAYGHIAHLPGSRMGPADHHCHEGQAAICTEKARDWRDTIIVQEKLDGSNCCVAMTEAGSILALTRAGYEARTSPYVQHHHFADYVQSIRKYFLALLEPGERVCGEWLAQAHGTRYKLTHEPFVPFDIFRDNKRIPYLEFFRRCTEHGFPTPRLLSYGQPMAVKEVLKRIQTSGHGALDPVEGAVWRVEREGEVDFLCKYVRPEKKDGVFLPEISGTEAVWNWGSPDASSRPGAASAEGSNPNPSPSSILGERV